MSTPATSAPFRPPQFPTSQLLSGAALLFGIVVCSFLILPALGNRILATNFLPHLYCYLGKPALVWAHVIADSCIGLAYFTISGTLAYLVHKGRRDIPFHWMFLAFGSFIIACGGTHFMEVVTTWIPVYVLSASVKVITAVVSLATALLLPFTVPQVLSLIRTAKATEAAEGRFRDLLEAAPDAVVVVNREGKIVLVNSQVDKLFGYRREELLAREIEMLVPGLFRTQPSGPRPDFQSPPRIPPMGASLELHGVHKLGHQFPVEISLGPLETEEGVLVSSAIRDISDRKRAEQSLRESEDRYRALVEALPDAVFVSIEERVVFVNPSAVRLLGAQRPEQIIGKDVSQLVHPGSLASIRDRIRNSSQTGVASPPMEHILLALDGSSVDVESASIPIFWKGSPAIEAIARDIGERKRTQARLQEYEKAVEGLEEMIVVLDRDYRYVLANRAYLNYRVMEKEQVVGHLAAEVIGKENFETVVREKLDECFRGKIITFEKKDRYPKLGERDMFVSYFPIEGSNGVDRVVCVLQDITERKQAERVVLRLAAIVESSDDAIISKDLNGVIRSWNAGAQRIFGYTEAEVVGQPITIIIPPELHDEEADILLRLGAGEHIQHYETARITKQGNRVNVSLTISPMRDSEGHVVGASKIARDITEWKLAQEALQRSEADAKARAEELAVIFDAVPGMALISHDAACSTITGSRVAYDLLRLPHGVNISKSAPEKERPRSFRILRDGHELSSDELPVQKAAASGQEVRDSEITVLFEDDTSREMLGNAAPLLDRNQKVRGAIGVFVDISERKRAEAALRDSEDRYRDLVEHSQDLLCTHDLDGKLLSANPAPARIFGYEVAALLQIPMRNLIAPEYREQFEAYLARMKSVGSAQGLLAVMTRAGERRIWEYHNTLRTEGVPFPIVRGMAHDITERLWAETALRRSEESYRNFVAQSSEGIFRQELDAPLPVDLPEDELVHHILHDSYLAECNDAMARMYGLDSHREFIGKRLTETLDPNDPLNIELTRHFIRSGFRVLERESHELDVLGNPKVFLNSMIGIVENGLLLRTWGIQRDITERVKSEEARKLAETALHESQTELARVARIVTMGELTASIAHEINQPLAAVTTNASASLHWLAVQPPNLDEARQAMANAMKEANRASDVIQRVRNLLQKTPPQLQPVDLNDVIRDVLALTCRELVAGGVSGHTDLAGDLPSVLGDRVQLQQVILNLVVNAVEAMTTITDRPRILFVRTATDADGVRIEVQDSGKGLDPGQASRIFESFFTTKPEGTGIGLSISRSIVEAHGGRLQAAPAQPHGALFEVILPKAA